MFHLIVVLHIGRHSFYVVAVQNVVQKCIIKTRNVSTVNPSIQQTGHCLPFNSFYRALQKLSRCLCYLLQTLLGEFIFFFDFKQKPMQSSLLAPVLQCCWPTECHLQHHRNPRKGCHSYLKCHHFRCCPSPNHFHGQTDGLQMREY